MAEPEAGPNSASPYGSVEWIDSVADRFEGAWKNDSVPPAISAFVAEATGEDRAILLRELVKIDVEYRCRTGPPRPVDEYCAEFPELLGPDGRPDSELVEFAKKVWLRQTDGPTPLAGGVTSPAARSPQPSRPDLLPDYIDKYRVVDRLGAGGQGLVFRAIHPALSKDVAIKVSAVPLDDDPLLCEQVLAEGRLLASLDHPNLVRVYDCGLHVGHVFIVMEYVRGRSLDQYARAAALAPRRAAALVAGVARCVAAVHQHGIVHQDLKPANVLIDEAGVPRLLDFGLARQRHLWADHSDEPAGGTPAYTSPEQARGDWEHVGPWSDVFAVGGLLYYLLTGRAPFAAATRSAALERAAACDLDRDALRSARVPRSLEAICLRAMAPKPRDRHSAAAALAEELERFARGPVWQRRAVLAALVLAPVAAVIGWPRPDPDPAPPARQEPPAGQTLIQVVERQWRGKKLGPAKSLVGALPLRQGDKFRIVCQVPRGASAAVFWLGSDGSVQELKDFRREPEGDFDRLTYPADGVVPVKGPPGTEFALVVANRVGQPLPRPEAIQALLTEPGSRGHDHQPAWPALPGTALVWLGVDEVRADWEEEPRSVGEPEQIALTEVEKRLQRLRRVLHERCDYFWGVAVPHL